MNGEYKLKLVADLAPIEPQQLRKWQETLKDLGQALNIPLEMEITRLQDVVRDVKSLSSSTRTTTGGMGPIIDPKTGRPFATTGGTAGMGGLPIDSLSRFGKIVKELSREFEHLNREVKRTSGKDGDGTDGLATTGVNTAKVAGIVAAVVKTAMFAAELPMERLRTRAAIGGTLSRDVQALGGTSFEDMMRMDPRMRGEAKQTGYTAGYAKSVGSGALWGGLGMLGLGALTVGTGGLTAPLVAALIAAGGVGGAGVGFLTGGHERAGLKGYEEALGRLAEERGVQREMYRGAREFGLGGGGRILRAGWMGEGDLARAAGLAARGPLSGYYGTQGGVEMASTGLGIMGRAAYDPDVATRTMRGGAIMNANMSTMLQFVNRMQTQAGGAGGASQDMSRIEEVIEKGVRRGVDNAETMRRYLDVVSRIVAQSGGGVGSGGAGIASDMALSAFRRLGFKGGIASRAAESSIGVTKKITGARTGFQGLANMMAIGGMGGNIDLQLALTGADAIEMEALLAPGGLMEQLGVPIPEGFTAERYEKESYGRGFAMSPWRQHSAIGQKLRTGKELTGEERSAAMGYLTQAFGFSPTKAATWLADRKQKFDTKRKIGRFQDLKTFRGMVYGEDYNLFAERLASSESDVYDDELFELGLDPLVSGEIKDLEALGEELQGGFSRKAEVIQGLGETATAGAGAPFAEKAAAAKLDQMKGIGDLLKTLGNVSTSSTSAADALDKVSAELRKMGSTLIPETPEETAQRAEDEARAKAQNAIMPGLYGSPKY